MKFKQESDFFSTYTEAAVQVLMIRALLTNWPECEDTLTYI